MFLMSQWLLIKSLSVACSSVVLRIKEGFLPSTSAAGCAVGGVEG